MLDIHVFKHNYTRLDAKFYAHRTDRDLDDLDHLCTNPSLRNIVQDLYVTDLTQETCARTWR